MKYFSLNMSLAQARQKYLELSKYFHPDKGGNTDSFNLLKKEYEEFKVIKKYEDEIVHSFRPNVVRVPERKPNIDVDSWSNAFVNGANLVNSIVNLINKFDSSEDVQENVEDNTEEWENAETI